MSLTEVTCLELKEDPNGAQIYLKLLFCEFCFEKYTHICGSKFLARFLVIRLNLAKSEFTQS